MLDIIERNGRWYANAKDSNGNPVEKSFRSASRAQAWAERYLTTKARYGPAGAPSETNPAKVTLGDLLARYDREFSSMKRGAQSEHYRIEAIRRRPIAQVKLRHLTSQHIAEYRNERLAEVGNSSVRIELCTLRRTLEVARREWGFNLSVNPASLVSLPALTPARDRRLRNGEYEKLQWAFADNPAMWALVRFAIETAMRQGEILALRWSDVDLRARMVRVRHSKTGNPRTVALTDGAVEVLEGLGGQGDQVLPLAPTAIRWAWSKACKAAGIRDLRFHDLRHEGCSRLFELGLSVPEVAMMSGHKTVSCLFRYTHLQPIDLAEKLKGRKRKSTDA